MALHAFVAMLFGTKEGINFNAVYNENIKPAFTEAGFEVFRADEEQRADDIRTDMFQELLAPSHGTAATQEKQTIQQVTCQSD